VSSEGLDERAATAVAGSQKFIAGMGEKTLKTVRILIPAPTPEDTFSDNVAVTLRAMGHAVTTLGEVTHAAYWSLGRRLLRMARSYLAGDRPGAEDRRVLRLAREFRPDVVLALTGQLHPETLAELGKHCPGRRVLWWGDAAANSRRWGLLDPGWDFVYSKDATTVRKLRLAGRNAFLLHEAMNPLWHRPLARRSNDEIAVVGNSYAFRQAVAVRLAQSGVSVRCYGGRPPAWSDPRYLALHAGRYVVREEKSRVFGEALACLNTFQLAEGDALNCRAFEIAGAGGLQLIEDRPAVRFCFEPGKEVIAFSTYDELLEAIRWAQRCPAEADAVRQAGARRALAEHTYQHRLETILQNLA